MADYRTFCDRCGLDSDSREARDQYREAAAAYADAQEAITEAKRKQKSLLEQ